MDNNTSDQQVTFFTGGGISVDVITLDNINDANFDPWTDSEFVPLIMVQYGLSLSEIAYLTS